MNRKLRIYLVAIMVVFIIINILIILYFRNTVAFTYDDFYFGMDATPLVSIINNLAMPYEPRVQTVLLLSRTIVVIIGSMMACCLAYRDRKYSTFGYVGIYIYFLFIHFMKLDITTVGIYNFFRKVAVSYYVGLIDYPWIYYYMAFVISVLLVIGMLVIELYIHRKVKGSIGNTPLDS